MVFSRKQVAHARSGDPQTSHDAAGSVHVTAGQRKVLEAFRENGSMTDEELVGRVDLTPSGARSRRAELVSLGILRDSGQTAESASGRRMTVWTAAAAERKPMNLWRCVACGAATLAEPTESTIDPRMRRGRCIGCDNGWSIHVLEAKSEQEED